MMVIGFTGTRHGMTNAQRDTVLKLLSEKLTPSSAVHGDCVGADADFDAICTSLDIWHVGDGWLRRSCRHSSLHRVS